MAGHGGSGPPTGAASTLVSHHTSFLCSAKCLVGGAAHAIPYDFCVGIPSRGLLKLREGSFSALFIS